MCKYIKNRCCVEERAVSVIWDTLCVLVGVCAPNCLHLRRSRSVVFVSGWLCQCLCIPQSTRNAPPPLLPLLPSNRHHRHCHHHPFRSTPQHHRIQQQHQQHKIGTEFNVTAILSEFNLNWLHTRSIGLFRICVACILLRYLSSVIYGTILMSYGKRCISRWRLWPKQTVASSVHVQRRAE